MRVYCHAMTHSLDNFIKRTPYPYVLSPSDITHAT
jgi:hypothetical protein